MSRMIHSSVCIVTRLRNKQSRVQIQSEARYLSLHQNIQTGSGALCPPIKQMLAALSTGVEKPGCAANHSSQTTAEVKNE
jgi:hypothetical protein